MKKIYYLSTLTIVTIVSVVFIKKWGKSDNDIPYHYRHQLELAEKVKGLTYEEIQKLPKQDRPDLAALQEFEMTMDPELGYPPIERSVEAFEHLKSDNQLMSKIQGKIDGVKWEERGPDNVAGRTRALMWDPNDQANKKVWAGGIGGGLWYNNDITNKNSKWNVVDDLMANISIGSINYDPSDTKIFYLGTGLGYTGVIRGAGIWKSTNGGNNWTQLASTKNSNFYFVQKIMVTEKGVVLVATNSGLFRSTDKGINWEKTQNGAISDIEIATDGSVYISKGHIGSSAILSSKDNGSTWNDISPSGGGRRIELACAPSDPNVIYAVAAAAGGSSGDKDVVWFKKSTDKGATWKNITIPLYVSTNCAISTNHFTRGQAWFDLILGVYPKDADRVIVGGIDLHMTEDGGNKWKGISYWTGSNNCDDYVHADQHAMVFNPDNPNEAVFGTDGGVFYSADLRKSNPEFHDRNNGYNVTTYYSVAATNKENSNTFLAGAQDNGTQLYRDPGMNSTSEATGGDGGYCFIDQDNSDIMISSYVRNDYRLSVNGGKSFKSISNDKTGRFINPTEYDSKANILYGAGANNELTRIRKITDTPTSLEKISVSMDNGTITALKASPYTDNLIYVGVQINRSTTKIYKIENTHTTTPKVTDINNNLDNNSNGWVSCIEIGASDNQLLVTYSNYGVKSVFETKDGGAKWVDKEGNLPDIPIRWALYNPNDRKEVLLATELGVWSTDDINKTNPEWESTNAGLANVRINMIKYRTSDGLIAIATFGRGMYTSNVFSKKSNADFSTKQTVAYVGVPVRFQDNSLNPKNSWSWKFGDGGLSAVQNPSHTYNKAGEYSVTLAIDGGKITKEKKQYITVLPKKNTPYSLADGGDFETNETDFVGKSLFNGVNHWEHGVPGNKLKTVSSGTKAWKTKLKENIKNRGFDFKSALYTPAFDLSDITKEYTLKFRKWMENSYCNSPHAMQLQYSIDGGASWNRLGGSQQEYGAINWYNRATDLSCSINDGVFQDKMGWSASNNKGLTSNASREKDNTVRNQNTEYKLNFLAGQPHISFRFVSSVVTSSTTPKQFDRDGFMIDDFEIVTSKIPAEFEALNVASFIGEDVHFAFLSNPKGVDKFSWDFGDGSPKSTEINPKHKYSASGKYTVTLTIDLKDGGQVVKKREKYIGVVPNRPIPYTLAQGGNFDTNENDFVAVNIKGTPIERGKSTIAGKDGTASGDFAWVTGLSAEKYENNSEAYLYSPNYDFSLLGTYTLKFKSKYSFEPDWEGFIVEYSIDKGKYWKKLNNEVKDGWYNQLSHASSIFGPKVPIFGGKTDGKYKEFKTNASFLASNKNVVFRIKFLTDPGTTDVGAAFDDFEVDGPKPGPATPNFKVSKTSGCKGHKITFTNNTTGSVSSISWDFGKGANPAKANGLGPYEVTYNEVGKSTVILTVNSPVNGEQEKKEVDFITTGELHKPTITQEKVDQNTTKLIASDGDSYQWYLNNKKIEGADKKTYTAKVVGNYSVEVSISGCIGRANDINIVSGIDLEDIDQVYLYPNPTYNGLFTLVSNQAKAVTIYNTLGKVIEYRNVSGGIDYDFNLFDQPNGLYIVVVKTKSEEVKLRVSIMK